MISFNWNFGVALSSLGDEITPILAVFLALLALVNNIFINLLNPVLFLVASVALILQYTVPEISYDISTESVGFYCSVVYFRRLVLG